jgi:hypothetical protein
MGTNVFNLIEGFFRGVIFFLYNTASSLFAAAVDPLHAPVRLQQRNGDPTEQQISSQTFLLITFFLCLGGASLYGVGSEFARTHVTGDEVRSDDFSHLLAMSVIATVLLDAPLRLFFSETFRARQRLFTVRLAVVEYALLWPVAASAIVAEYLEYVTRAFILAPRWPTPETVSILVGAAVLTFSASIPAGLLASQTPFPVSAKTRILRASVSATSIALLVLWASTGAIFASQWLLDHARSDTSESGYIRDLNCRAGAGAIHVDLVVEMTGDQAVLVDFPSIIEFRLYSAAGRARVEQLGPLLMPIASADRASTLLEPEKVQVVRLRYRAAPKIQPGRDIKCRVEASEASSRFVMFGSADAPLHIEE